MLRKAAGKPSLFTVLFMTQMFQSITSHQCGAGIHSIFQKMLRGHTYMTIESQAGWNAGKLVTLISDVKAITSLYLIQSAS